MKLILAILLMMFSSSPQVHAGEVYRTVFEKAGIDQDRFVSFISRTREVLATRSKAPSPCLLDFGDSTVSRNQFLDCLTDGPEDLFSEASFRVIFELRLERLRSKHRDSEALRSIVLLGFIEDLVRERLQQTFPSESYRWYHREKGFLKDLWRHGDFPFENGDVVIGMGGSSISALITNSTTPPARFSHALVIGTSKAGKHTIEATVESGVVQKPWASKKGFANDSYLQVAVLRHASRSDAVAAEAVQIAENFAALRTPYDIKMDMKDQTAMFCSELVVYSFARASGKAKEEVPFLLQEQSILRSDKSKEFLRLIGVDSEKMASPADLQTTSEFDTIAEYRDIDNFIELYGAYLFGEEFFQRIELGYRLNYSIDYHLLKGVAAGIDASARGLGAVIGRDWALIPRSLSADALRAVALVDFMYNRINRKIDKFLQRTGRQRSLRDLAPHELALLQREAMDSPRFRRRLCSKLDCF